MAVSISETLKFGVTEGIITEPEVDQNMWCALGDFITLVTPEIVLSNREPREVMEGMSDPKDDNRVALHAQLRSILTQAMDGTAVHHDKVAVIASAAIATAQALEELPIFDGRVTRFYDIFGCLPADYLKEFCV